MRNSTKWQVWLQIRHKDFEKWVNVGDGSEAKCTEIFNAFKKDGSTVKLAEVSRVFHDSHEVKEIAPGKDDRFEEFWKLYPRSVDKKTTHSAYIRACKRDTTHEGLMVAVRSFIKASEGTEEQFIPHPTTWLNRGRYLECELPTQKVDIMLLRVQSHRETGVWLPSWGPEPKEIKK